ncbi:uncharacterized protein [Argopecten irradians]|uniref:uncharacterized protein n=1 Tax=Argopecten irradians TaxID=31199 RepID=UPI00371918E2
MGSKPSRLDEVSLPNIEDRRMDEGISYKDLICVKTKPWDPEKRNKEFPSKEIQNDKITIESTVIGVDISSPTLTEAECAKRDIYPMPYVTLESKTEKESFILKNSDGFMEVIFEPKTPTRNAIYTFHVRQRGKETWTRHEVKMKVGQMTVGIETDQFDIDAVFITSEVETQTFDVTKAGGVMELDPQNEDMKLDFPPGAVRSTMTVTVEVTSLDEAIKSRKITQLLGKDHGMLGISDKVNVTHEHNFQVPVRLTLPIQSLQPTPEGEQPTALVLYVEDGEVKELESATIKEVEPNLFEVTTDHFCPVIVTRQRQLVRSVQIKSVVKLVYNLDDPRCNILLFSKIITEGKLLYLRSEIVSQDERKEMSKERMEELGMNLIQICTSPTIRLKNMDRVRVSLALNTAIRFPMHSPRVSPFIMFDSNNKDNSLSFYVERHQAYGVGEFATLEYDVDKGKYRRPLHKATFHVLTEMKKRKNLGLSMSSSRETLYKTSGLQSIVYKREVSGPQSPSSYGSDTSGIPKSIGAHGNISVDIDEIKKTAQHGHEEHDKRIPKCKDQSIQGKYAEVFSEKSMALLARQIPDREYHTFATCLHVPIVTADQLAENFPHPQDKNQLKLRLLLYWLDNESTNPFIRLKVLKDALIGIEQTALAERFEKAFNKKDSFKMRE